jgi:protein-tyrosine phosphatase
MPRFIDLHCHWIAAIDDGCRAPEAGIALLRGLGAIGFGTVVATPHMRPGMFDNDRAELERAYAAMDGPIERARAEGPLPDVHLSSEHYFDDTVFERIRKGEGCPYPDLGPVAAAGTAARARKRGVLVEFNPERFPQSTHHRFFDLHRAGFYPVIAHPERYAPVWKDTDSLSPLVEAGAYLLLDVCSLVGKYGRAAQKASEKLLDAGAYLAACSDAHKPEDLEAVAQGIERLRKLAGDDGVEDLLTAGPRQILHLPESVVSA